MSNPRIFIDGHAGTTGLRIRQWLADRDDLETWTLPESERKSEAARKKAIAEADLTILCLPDDAAREAARWADEAGARVIDASSAHRVDREWVYGLPEMQPAQRDAIRNARFVTNPGCYATAFVLLVRPLVDAGLLARDAALTIHGLSGYSGGGKALIERWESTGSERIGLPYEAPYALERVHKHVPEMQHHAGLREAPQFIPAVGPFACGMRVEVPIHRRQLASGVSGRDAWKTLSDHYRDEPFVGVAPFVDLEPIGDFTLDPRTMNGTNRIELHVIPNAAGHLFLVGLLDNLGKGASGGAIQSLNLMLGLPETTGLPG
ncbi:MAG TPA: N-acetyl-gamma-glutamyl-phosphate reductase [Deltaproteobacteria bacterium]|nr:N-acetyl-gamma-glutamyl-phosphate reductase [Deltaproteobacteria bacterium]